MNGARDPDLRASHVGGNSCPSMTSALNSEEQDAISLGKLRRQEGRLPCIGLLTGLWVNRASRGSIPFHLDHDGE